WVDKNSHTSMPQLFAVGETSCNGVHGANRLASMKRRKNVNIKAYQQVRVMLILLNRKKLW
ncbi:MAG: FAD-binding protein, partial [Haemophilus parahaemolyticus]